RPVNPAARCAADRWSNCVPRCAARAAISASARVVRATRRRTSPLQTIEAPSSPRALLRYNACLDDRRCTHAETGERWMVDLDLEGTTVILAVAQLPFDKEGESGVWNSFSTLVPILYED